MNESQPTNRLNKGHDPSDLDWLAFQYIAGELTAAQAEFFEDRLSTDQDAREAVARAVKLTENTVLAEHTVLAELAAVALGTTPVVVKFRRQWITTAVWTICGIAAGVAILLTLAGMLRSPANQNGGGFQGSGTQIAERHGEVRELAMAWATGRTDLTSEATEEASPEEASHNEVLALPGVEAEEVEGIETPSWMLVAVAELSQNSADGAGLEGLDADGLDRGEQGLE